MSCISAEENGGMEWRYGVSICIFDVLKAGGGCLKVK